MSEVVGDFQPGYASTDIIASVPIVSGQQIIVPGDSFKSNKLYQDIGTSRLQISDIAHHTSIDSLMNGINACEDNSIHVDDTTHKMFRVYSHNDYSYKCMEEIASKNYCYSIKGSSVTTAMKFAEIYVRDEAMSDHEASYLFHILNTSQSTEDTVLVTVNTNLSVTIKNKEDVATGNVGAYVEQVSTGIHKVILYTTLNFSGVISLKSKTEPHGAICVVYDSDSECTPPSDAVLSEKDTSSSDSGSGSSGSTTQSVEPSAVLLWSGEAYTGDIEFYIPKECFYRSDRLITLMINFLPMYTATIYPHMDPVFITMINPKLADFSFTNNNNVTYYTMGTYSNIATDINANAGVSSMNANISLSPVNDDRYCRCTITLGIAFNAVLLAAVSAIVPQEVS